MGISNRLPIGQRNQHYYREDQACQWMKNAQGKIPIRQIPGQQPENIQKGHQPKTQDQKGKIRALICHRFQYNRASDIQPDNGQGQKIHCRFSLHITGYCLRAITTLEG